MHKASRLCMLFLYIEHYYSYVFFGYKHAPERNSDTLFLLLIKTESEKKFWWEDDYYTQKPKQPATNQSVWPWFVVTQYYLTNRKSMPMPKEAMIIVERGENQMRMAKRPGLIPGILVVTLLGFVVVWTPLKKSQFAYFKKRYFKLFLSSST